MTGPSRLRRLAPYCVAAGLALALTACATYDRTYPNSTFWPHSDLGRAIDDIWKRLLLLGTIVFVLVEAALIYVIFRYRRRSDDIVPPQTHGNVTLEITWTLIPAAILVFIAVPTVRTIFQTQQNAPANALKIEVYGHQWWWEFRYPQYNVTTANEIYVPKGRTIDLVLRTKDVLHSFWMPQLAGKRDLIANHTNHIVFTPDARMETTVWNGFCTEYCGDSHAEMHFRVVTVDPPQFDSWVTHQNAPAFFNTSSAPAQPAATAPTKSAPNQATPVNTPQNPSGFTTASMVATPAQLASFVFPRAQVPEYAIPHTPLPNIRFNETLHGDPASGEKLFVGAGTCNACHSIAGNPLAMGQVGPNLTHVGSRIAIAAGMYQNDKVHLERWIKNARLMKSGVLMPTLGKGEYDPQTKQTIPAGLTDQQIADLVAYLQALK